MNEYDTLEYNNYYYYASYYYKKLKQLKDFINFKGKLQCLKKQLEEKAN